MLRVAVIPRFAPRTVDSQSDQTARMGRMALASKGQPSKRTRQDKEPTGKTGGAAVYHCLDLRKRVARGRFFFVSWHALDRRLAFCLEVADVWFELAPGETLADRAADLLTALFRQRGKEDEDDFISPEKYALEGTPWVTPLDLDIYPAQKIESPEDARRGPVRGPSTAGCRRWRLIASGGHCRRQRGPGRSRGA